jgi:hypothetical protein
LTNGGERPKEGRAEISALDEIQIVGLLNYLDGTMLGSSITRGDTSWI